MRPPHAPTSSHRLPIGRVLGEGFDRRLLVLRKVRERRLRPAGSHLAPEFSPLGCDYTREDLVRTRGLSLTARKPRHSCASDGLASPPPKDGQHNNNNNNNNCRVVTGYENLKLLLCCQVMDEDARYRTCKIVPSRPLPLSGISPSQSFAIPGCVLWSSVDYYIILARARCSLTMPLPRGESGTERCGPT